MFLPFHASPLAAVPESQPFIDAAGTFYEAVRADMTDFPMRPWADQDPEFQRVYAGGILVGATVAAWQWNSGHRCA